MTARRPSIGSGSGTRCTPGRDLLVARCRPSVSVAGSWSVTGSSCPPGAAGGGGHEHAGRACRPSWRSTTTTRIRREAHRQVTDRDVLDAILDEALVAHVGVVRDGRPLVLPFACARDGDHLLLHGSTGSGLLRIAAGDEVCVRSPTSTGWCSRGRRSTPRCATAARSCTVWRGGAGVRTRRARSTCSRSTSSPGVRRRCGRPTAKELAATLVLRVSAGDRASVKVAAGPPEVDPDDHEPRSVWAGIVPLALRADQPRGPRRAARGRRTGLRARHPHPPRGLKSRNVAWARHAVRRGWCENNCAANASPGDEAAGGHERQVEGGDQPGRRGDDGLDGVDQPHGGR